MVNDVKVLQQDLVSLQNSRQLQQLKRPNNTQTYAKVTARSTCLKSATATTATSASVTVPIFQQREPLTNDDVPGGAEPMSISEPKKFVKVAGAREVWGTMSETS